MKEKRSLFSRIFGTDKSTVAPSTATTFEILDNTKARFTQYDGNFENDIDIIACVDAIARNGAKMHPRHIRNSENKYEVLNDNIYRLLAKRPNELQNAFKFYYQIIADYELYNNAFVYIHRNKDKVVGLYPLSFRSVKLYEYKDEIYVQFKFKNGKTRFVSYNDVIHLTKGVSKDGVYGGSTVPLIKTLSIKHILDEGIVNAIKVTQDIKGIIKSTKSMMKAEDVKKMRDQFVDDFINNGDGTGIGGLDSMTDFTPVKIEPKTASDGQIEKFDKKILSYFGVSEEIIQSKYTEDQWNAFYESVLEPIGLQLSLEFTNKIFTPTEIYHGNEIIFECNRLQYASNNTKINLVRYANNILTVNEMREVFNLSPLPNGDVIMQDLNHIDSTIANDYQLGNSTNDNQDDSEDDTNVNNEGGADNEGN